MLFEKYENTGFGEMTLDCYRQMLCDIEFRNAISNFDANALRKLEIRADSCRRNQQTNNTITCQEFIDLVRWALNGEVRGKGSTSSQTTFTPTPYPLALPLV